MIKTATLLAAGIMACSAAQAQFARSRVDFGAVFNANRDSIVDNLAGTGLPTGAAWDIGSTSAVMLNYEFFATPNVGLQLSTGIGGSVDVNGAGSLATLGTLFKADTLAATLFVNYHFFEPTNALRPFLGLGVNYTGFSSITSYQGQTVDMGNSWAAAVQAGARYSFNQYWSAFVSLGMNWSKSDVTVTTTTGTQTATIDFRPVVVGVGAGFSF